MMKIIFKLLLLMFFPIMLQSDGNRMATYEKHDFCIEPLQQEDKDWFVEAFVKSFMSSYRPLTYVVTYAGKDRVVGPDDLNIKEEVLRSAASKQFDAYVVHPGVGYHALRLMYRGESMGVFLYQLLDKGETIYCAEGFVIPEWQHRGVGGGVFFQELAKMYPQCKRYEVLVCHQNAHAILFYWKSGFSIGDAKLVEKHGYDPLRYMSFYKNLK